MCQMLLHCPDTLCARFFFQYVGSLAGANPAGKPGGSTNVARYRDGESSSALFNSPFGIAIDRTRGLIYASDSNGNKLRTITFRSRTPRFSIPGGTYNSGPRQTAVSIIAWAGDNVKVTSRTTVRNRPWKALRW